MKVQRVLIGVAVVVVMAACGASESTQPSASPETVVPTTTTIYEVNHGVAVNPELVRASAGSVVNSLPSATVDSICDAYANALAAGATQDQLYGTFLQVLGEYFTGTGVPNREIFDELNRRC